MKVREQKKFRKSTKISISHIQNCSESDLEENEPVLESNNCNDCKKDTNQQPALVNSAAASADFECSAPCTQAQEDGSNREVEHASGNCHTGPNLCRTTIDSTSYPWGISLPLSHVTQCSGGRN